MRQLQVDCDTIGEGQNLGGLKSYLNGMLTNEEVIEELMKMAQDI